MRLLLTLPTHHFNPRTHEECDITGVRTRTQLRQFQSTHSRGVRHLESFEGLKADRISIHALTRSATCCAISANSLLIISIHALTRSATFLKRLRICPLLSFQSTHSRGVRRALPFTGFRFTLISIHALTRSATARRCPRAAGH